jgi:hypothetical protein
MSDLTPTDVEDRLHTVLVDEYTDEDTAADIVTVLQETVTAMLDEAKANEHRRLCCGNPQSCALPLLPTPLNPAASAS